MECSLMFSSKDKHAFIFSFWSANLNQSSSIDVFVFAVVFNTQSKRNSSFFEKARHSTRNLEMSIKIYNIRSVYP